MNVIKYNEVETHPNPHGVDVRKMLVGNKYQVIVGTLNPGDRIPKHPSDVDALFYVLEGEGTLELGDEVVTVRQDTLIECPAFVEKGWTNNTESVLRFLAIKIQ